MDQRKITETENAAIKPGTQDYPHPAQQPGAPDYPYQAQQPGPAPRPQAACQEDGHRRFMRKNYAFFGGASILYALFYTFCLYRNASGITYPFFVAGTLVYFYLCTKRSGVPWKKDSVFYMVSILLLGTSVFLTDNRAIHFFTKTGIFLLLISLMLHQYLNDEKWNFSKYLTAIGQALIETVASMGHPVSDGNAWMKEREQSGGNGKGRYVILGILILIPLLLVILALLVSADAVFRDLFVRAFEHIDMLDFFGILFTVTAAFFGSYCFIAMLNKRIIRDTCVDRRNQEPVLAITFTSVLAVVYLLFCVIQVVYLFLGKMELPEGYSYSLYARQGFFQLLAVCVINLVIVLSCLAFFRENMVLKGILTLISLCTYVLVASSGYRMALYINACQLTFLRILVLWALLVIAVMLLGILFSIFRPDFRLFRYLTVTVTVCYIVLAFAKTDYWIARYNMSFVDKSVAYDSGEEQGYRDYVYLSGLSADAAPVLAEAENYIYLSRSSYAMEDYYDRMLDRAEDDGVRSFNLSRYLAGRAVRAARGE